MPTVSRFLGILIQMFHDEHHHSRPHFHAKVGEHSAVFDIATGEILVGEIPLPKAKVVIAWAEVHKKELLANWRRLKAGEKHVQISPRIT